MLKKENPQQNLIILQGRETPVTVEALLRTLLCLLCCWKSILSGSLFCLFLLNYLRNCFTVSFEVGIQASNSAKWGKGYLQKWLMKTKREFLHFVMFSLQIKVPLQLGEDLHNDSSKRPLWLSNNGL